MQFKNFEDFWCDDEKKRKEKWKKLWDMNEKNECEKESNLLFNVCNEKSDLTDFSKSSSFDKSKGDANLNEKKNFRIRLSSQLLEEKDRSIFMFNGFTYNTAFFVCMCIFIFL